MMEQQTTTAKSKNAVLIARIDARLKRTFAKMCIDDGVTMTAKLEQMIRERIQATRTCAEGSKSIS
jgi:hypothetical protein